MKAFRIAAVLLVVLCLGVAAWLWIGGAPPTPDGVGPSQFVPPRVPANSFGAASGRKSRTAVVILPSIEDRLSREPCNVLPGGGVYSLATLLDESLDFGPVVGVSMGDATLAEGPVGADQLRLIYGLVVPRTRISVVCPGEGELGQGAAFVRKELREFTAGNGFEIVCGNITDSAGQPLMRGFTIAKVTADPPGEQIPRSILFVSVAARSLKTALDVRGSDIVVTSPVDAIAAALVAGRQRAAEAGLVLDEYILLVQGTVEETRDLLTPDSPFAFAVAARGPVLPDLEPLREGARIPVYYAGRGMRFGWQVFMDDEATVSHSGHLVRLGELMAAKGSPFTSLIAEYRLDLGRVAFKALIDESRRPAGRNGGYVGARRCAACHVEEVAAHDGSAHARRNEKLPVLVACMRCHVTGADFAGGWTGPEDDSERASVSCESCHGPGGDHADAPGTKPYGKFSLSRCTECHLPDHGPLFDAQELWSTHGHSAPRTR